MLNEVSYCERLFHLMHVQGLFEPSVDTVEGTIQHDRATKSHRIRVEEPAPDLPAPRTLMLGDAELGIVGKLDTIRAEDGQWVPFEEKHSAAPVGNPEFVVLGQTLDSSAWPNDQIQLCAQGLLMRANGYPCAGGFLFYRGNRKKVFLHFTETLITATLASIERAKEIEASRTPPPPLVDSPKCPRCSLNAICLPDEVNQLTRGEPSKARLITHRDDAGVLYVSEPGTRLTKKSESLVLLPREGKQVQIPLKDISHASVVGPGVQISTPLLHALGSHGISVTFLSNGGRFLGQFTGAHSVNALMRRWQFLRFESEETRLKLAREIVRAKVSNQRTLLRRNGKTSAQVLKELKDVLGQLEGSSTTDSIRGLEGYAGRLYMGHFLDMVKVPVEVDGKTIMAGRSRRPPKDPVNALLSLGYSLLVRDLVVAISAVGLDPYYGFFHAMEPGRPALALDIMEPYRALIADSLAIRLLNTRELRVEDFYWGPEACVLKDGPRRQYWAAYEQRMGERITHPMFGYRLSYRRTLELEVRLLGKYLMQDIPTYQALVTR